ncbi:MAG: hypothetical protein ABIP45_02210 [Knoellia sp.]
MSRPDEDLRDRRREAHVAVRHDKDLPRDIQAQSRDLLLERLYLRDPFGALSLPDTAIALGLPQPLAQRLRRVMPNMVATEFIAALSVG